MSIEFSTNMLYIGIAVLLTILTVYLLFYWEDWLKLTFRLPVINLLTLVVLLILGTIEQFYLTCHPEKRNKLFRTSIFQRFFNTRY